MSPATPDIHVPAPPATSANTSGCCAFTSEIDMRSPAILLAFGSQGWCMSSEPSRVCISSPASDS
eukprot:321998-Prymnesium_polylepis.1